MRNGERDEIVHEGYSEFTKRVDQIQAWYGTLPLGVRMGLTTACTVLTSVWPPIIIIGHTTYAIRKCPILEELLVSAGWVAGWLITRVNCGERAGRIAFIFGTQVEVEHRNIVLDGHPFAHKIRELEAQSFWFNGKVWKNFKRS